MKYQVILILLYCLNNLVYGQYDPIPSIHDKYVTWATESTINYDFTDTNAVQSDTVFNMAKYLFEMAAQEKIVVLHPKTRDTLSLSELLKIKNNRSVEKQLVIDPITLIERSETYTNNFKFEHINKLKVVTQWYYNQYETNLYSVIKEISPLYTRSDKEGNFIADIPLFILKMKPEMGIHDSCKTFAFKTSFRYEFDTQEMSNSRYWTRTDKDQDTVKYEYWNGLYLTKNDFDMAWKEGESKNFGMKRIYSKSLSKVLFDDLFSLRKRFIDENEINKKVTDNSIYSMPNTKVMKGKTFPKIQSIEYNVSNVNSYIIDQEWGFNKNNGMLYSKAQSFTLLLDMYDSAGNPIGVKPLYMMDFK